MFLLTISYVVGDILLIVFLTMGASISLCIVILLLCMFCPGCPLFKESTVSAQIRNSRSRSTHANNARRVNGVYSKKNPPQFKIHST